MSSTNVLRFVVCLLALLCTVDLCEGWDQAELDLFDLVEEIGENFYDVLHVDQTATSSEIKRSFRQLSLQLHPDKSDDPDATEKFRKVVAVAEVLKDPELRERYNLILVEGLPDWRQPIFYYRRVRKMGLLELTALLLVIGSVGQYLFGLAVYVEKKLEMQEVLTRKQKKSVKKSKTAKASASSQRLEEELSFLNEQATASIPEVHNLLPFWLAKKVIALAKFSWSLFSQWRHSLPPISKSDESEKSQSHDSVSAKSAEKTNVGVNGGLDEDKDGSESDVGTSKDRTATCSTGDVNDESESKVKRRRGKWVPDELRVFAKQEEEKPYVPPAYYCNDEEEEELDSEEEEDFTSSSDVDDVSQLEDNQAATVVVPESEDTKKKVDRTGPTEQNNSINGTQKLDSERVEDVAKIKAKKILNEKKVHLDEDVSKVYEEVGNGIVMVTNPKDGSLSLSWSRYQQKQLEWALVQYPKFTKDRWDKIAKAVPEKNKEECIERFKELCSVIKNKKVAENKNISL